MKTYMDKLISKIPTTHLLFSTCTILFFDASYFKNEFRIEVYVVIFFRHWLKQKMNCTVVGYAVDWCYLDANLALYM